MKQFLNKLCCTFALSMLFGLTNQVSADINCAKISPTACEVAHSACVVLNGTCTVATGAACNLATEKNMCSLLGGSWSTGAFPGLCKTPEGVNAGIDPANCALPNVWQPGVCTASGSSSCACQTQATCGVAGQSNSKWCSWNGQKCVAKTPAPDASLDLSTPDACEAASQYHVYTPKVKKTPAACKAQDNPACYNKSKTDCVKVGIGNSKWCYVDGPTTTNPQCKSKDAL